MGLRESTKSERSSGKYRKQREEVMGVEELKIWPEVDEEEGGEEENAMWWVWSDGATQRRFGAENDDDDRLLLPTLL